MKKLLIPIFIVILLLAGCGSESPYETATPQITEELSPSPLLETNDNTDVQPMFEVTSLRDIAELIDETSGEDGTYRTEFLYDYTVKIVEEQVPYAEGELSIAAQIDALNGTAAAGINIATDDTLTQYLTYPVWRITYTTGTNEDTLENVDIYIQTDTMNYRLHISVPADFYEDYEDTIEGWIASVDWVN